MSNSRSQDNMRKALFYTFLAIFVATAAVTLLGITGVVAIGDFYLKGLFSALLLELVGAVIGLYKATPFFQPQGPAPLWGRILQPSPDQLVARTFDCSGYATGVRPPWNLWLAVEANGFVWPKEGPVVVGANDQWTAQVFEDGRSPEFALSLFAAKGAADKAIRTWLSEGSRKGEYAEVKSFPGVQRLHRVDRLRL
ncbi:MAG: hypothetical protein ABSD62_13315 [Candidatus Limnocylindrales bacterium]|jgi:hypothetical protein